MPAGEPTFFVSRCLPLAEAGNTTDRSDKDRAMAEKRLKMSSGWIDEISYFRHYYPIGRRKSETAARNGLTQRIGPMNNRITALAVAAIATGTLLMQQSQATLVEAYGSDGQGTGLQTKLNPLVKVVPDSGDTWSKGSLSGSDYINGTVQLGQSPMDVFWNLAGPGASATIVLEIAGYSGANTFGFYDPADSSKKAQLFSGSDAAKSRVYVKFNGTQLQSSGNNRDWNNVIGGGFGSTTFGMYLQGPAGTFYSDPTMNPGGGDNLVAYQGALGRTIKIGKINTAWDANSYVLGWEDLVLASSDHDYQDMVLLVSQIIPALPVAGATPVPEARTVIAGLLLLLPLGASTIRILRKNRAV